MRNHSSSKGESGKNVSVSRVIQAQRSEIFSVLANPFLHDEIDGSGTGGYTMNNPFDEAKLDMWTHRVSYNPYKGSHFVARGLQDTVWNPVARASMVALTNYQGKPLIQSKNNVMIPHNYI